MAISPSVRVCESAYIHMSDCLFTERTLKRLNRVTRSLSFPQRPQTGRVHEKNEMVLSDAHWPGSCESPGGNGRCEHW